MLMVGECCPHVESGGRREVGRIGPKAGGSREVATLRESWLASRVYSLLLFFRCTASISHFDTIEPDINLRTVSPTGLDKIAATTM